MEYEQKIYELETKIEPLKVIRVKCPGCGTCREVTKMHQNTVKCENKQCLTKSGQRRIFLIMKHIFVDGKIIEHRVNLA